MPAEELLDLFIQNGLVINGDLKVAFTDEEIQTLFKEDFYLWHNGAPPGVGPSGEGTDYPQQPNEWMPYPTAREKGDEGRCTGAGWIIPKCYQGERGAPHVLSGTDQRPALWGTAGPAEDLDIAERTISVTKTLNYNTGTPKRSRCKDSVLHAGTLQRGLHSGHLHSRYHEDADRSRRQIGRIHGAIILKYFKGIDKKLPLKLMLQGELVRVGRLERPVS